MAAPFMPTKEVDFMVLKEDWSRYFVNYCTELRIRAVVRKILEAGPYNPNGYPNFGIESINAVSAIVPDKLKRQPSTTILDLNTAQGQEMGFMIHDEKWQEYQTTDGFKVMVKPVLVKVWKYESYNSLGEPIYNVNIQNIINAERLSQPSKK
jgi:hypothetical protein